MQLIKTENFEIAIYKNGDPDSNKLAIVLPGKLDTKDYANMRTHVDFLAQKGFFALSIDPPGTWESSGNINAYTTSSYANAVKEIIKYFGDKDTFLMGHSRGSTIALEIGATHPSIIGVAAVMCSYNIKGFPLVPNEKWRQTGYVVCMRELPPGTGEKVKRFELPYSFYEDQMIHNFTEALKISQIPKLFILGKNDIIAKPEIVRETYNTSGNPKELVEIESDHDYRYDMTKIDKVNKILESFLLKYNLL